MPLSNGWRDFDCSRVRVVVFVLACLPIPTLGHAQAVDSADTPIINQVVIQRADIFDAAELTKWYARVANSLHVMTRESVIKRELLFSAGQPYDSARVAETARNLRGMGIFRRVTIDTVRSDSGLVVRVLARDAWSTQVDARLSVGGNEIAWLLNLSEINFLGTGNRGTVQYGVDPDRSALTTRYRGSRFFGTGLAFDFYLDARSDGTIFSTSVGKPFRTLDTRSSYDAQGLIGDFDVLLFRDGDPVPAEILRRKAGLARLSGNWTVSGDRHRHWRVGITGQIQRDDFVPDSAIPNPFPKTITGAAGGQVSLTFPRFAVARAVLGFGREEDVNLTTSTTAAAWAAPRMWGYQADGLGLLLEARTGAAIGDGYALVGGRVNGLFTTAGLDSGTAVIGGSIALKPSGRQLIMLHAQGGWQRNPTPGAEFDLGLAFGLRAYPAHAYTGTQMFYWSAEYRRVFLENAFGLFAVALAGFVDHGGAWYDNAPARSGWDAGVGLRFGINRSPEPDAIRVDMAYRFDTDVLPAEWVLSIGRSFPFSLIP